MEARLLDTFRERYPVWLEENRSLMEAGDFKTAMQGFPFIRPDDTPWAPLAKDLADSRLAVLSTAGLYVAGEQAPFRAEHIEGDWSHRELPADVAFDRLRIAHTHYPHDHAEADLNCVFPLERLREAVADGTVGALNARHFSISGYCTRLDRVVEETAPPIVEALRRDGVDAVLHVPV